jgi:hypothetical protein
MPYIVKDSTGREVLIQKPTEKSARKAFEDRERETHRLFPSMPIRKIVNIRKA